MVVHMVVENWHNYSGICELVYKAAADLLAEQNITQEQDNVFIIEESNQARIIVLKYIDWAVTSYNEVIPDVMWSPPSPHPCSIMPNGIEINDLVNAGQCHTSCFCIGNKPIREIKCRLINFFLNEHH